MVLFELLLFGLYLPDGNGHVTAADFKVGFPQAAALILKRYPLG
jgi:hypothetical protein